MCIRDSRRRIREIKKIQRRKKHYTEIDRDPKEKDENLTDRNWTADANVVHWYGAVSYTHLDVYKRQFIYWLKTHVGKEKITEVTAADYLEQKRREIPEFLDLSFPTIAGYKSCLLYTS